MMTLLTTKYETAAFNFSVETLDGAQVVSLFSAVNCRCTEYCHVMYFIITDGIS